MGNRRQAREAAMSYLYQKALKVDPLTHSPESFVQHFKVPEPFIPFFKEIVRGVETYEKDLDDQIEACAENWKLYRIDKLDLSILRLATFELLHCPKTDHQVIIDEAVELAKTYGSEASPSFINGILDPIAKKCRS